MVYTERKSITSREILYMNSLHFSTFKSILPPGLILPSMGEMVRCGGRGRVCTWKPPSLVPALEMVNDRVTIWRSATRLPKSTMLGETWRCEDGGRLRVGGGEVESGRRGGGEWESKEQYKQRSDQLEDHS